MHSQINNLNGQLPRHVTREMAIKTACVFSVFLIACWTRVYPRDSGKLIPMRIVTCLNKELGTGQYLLGSWDLCILNFQCEKSLCPIFRENKQKILSYHCWGWTKFKLKNDYFSQKKVPVLSPFAPVSTPQYILTGPLDYSYFLFCTTNKSVKPQAGRAYDGYMAYITFYPPVTSTSNGRGYSNL